MEIHRQLAFQSICPMGVQLCSAQLVFELQVPMKLKHFGWIWCFPLITEKFISYREKRLLTGEKGQTWKLTFIFSAEKIKRAFTKMSAKITEERCHIIKTICRWTASAGITTESDSRCLTYIMSPSSHLTVPERGGPYFLTCQTRRLIEVPSWLWIKCAQQHFKVLINTLNHVFNWESTEWELVFLGLSPPGAFLPGDKKLSKPQSSLHMSES